MKDKLYQAQYLPERYPEDTDALVIESTTVIPLSNLTFPLLTDAKSGIREQVAPSIVISSIASRISGEVGSK